MNPSKFLGEYLNLQTGIMYDRLDDLGFAKVGFCACDPSPFWNLALVNQNLSDSQLLEIEKHFGKLGRKPSIYFEKKPALETLENYLKSKQYRLINEDSWMFYVRNDIDQTHFASLKEVTSRVDLDVFLGTFNACYRKDDPQNPYGELGDYLKVAERSWIKHQETDRLHYYLVYKDSVPVAVTTLTVHGLIGYISNVGSLLSIRGQGYGKAATLFCVQESQKFGCHLHCLATEEGSYPNQFYQRIGFKTKFRAPLYVKQSS